MTAQQPQGAPNTTGSVSTDTATGPDPYRATQGENVTVPKRIQRKRSRGWRMPADAVYVGRPTKWGNPWSIGEHHPWYGDTPMDAAKVVAVYRYAYDTEAGRELVRAELAGKDLACWCPLGEPCHADVLLRLANTADPSTEETAP